MAYEPKNLSALGYANGFTLWHYRTADVVEEVASAGYFSPARLMLRHGDFLLVNAAMSHALGSGNHLTLVVTANKDGSVETSVMGAA